MIRSMTGYGQASRRVCGYGIQIDIKTVNHRFSEIMIRMPKAWLDVEDRLKTLVRQQVKRGRVDVFVTMERDAESPRSVSVNMELAQRYHQALEQLKTKFGIADNVELRDLLAVPDLIVFEEDAEEDRKRIGQALEEAAGEAMRHLVQMRQTEGANIGEDLSGRFDQLERWRGRLLELAPHVVEEYREKLAQRLQELSDLQHVDEQRLAVETAVYADRSSIDEELTRLHSHFRQGFQLLESGEPVGRKLDFLVQEMNREVNTIGSKSNHKDISAMVIDMKAELEKIREQVQNIE